MNAALVRQVRRRAGDCCEYCRMPQEYDDTPFEIDHIIAKKHGGRTVAYNISLSCFYCNSFKGSDIASRDAKTGKLTPLFNPRRQKWSRHFRWQGAYLVGRTAVGRVTVALLHINDPLRLELRGAYRRGSFPSRLSESGRVAKNQNHAPRRWPHRASCDSGCCAAQWAIASGGRHEQRIDGFRPPRVNPWRNSGRLSRGRAPAPHRTGTSLSRSIPSWPASWKNSSPMTTSCVNWPSRCASTAPPATLRPRPVSPCRLTATSWRFPPKHRSYALAITSCFRRLPAAAWASSTRHGRSASIAWSPSR